MEFFLLKFNRNLKNKDAVVFSEVLVVYYVHSIGLFLIEHNGFLSPANRIKSILILACKFVKLTIEVHFELCC